MKISQQIEIASRQVWDSKYDKMKVSPEILSDKQTAQIACAIAEKGSQKRNLARPTNVAFVTINFAIAKVFPRRGSLQKRL